MNKCEKCGHEQHGIAPPDGMVLVPKEPTKEMLFNMRGNHWEISGCQLCDDDYEHIYSAILAAAPEVKP